MTPQGLADAIGRLVDDLPAQQEKASGTWQRVLALQALTTVLGGNWYDADASHELHTACSAAQSAVSAALKVLFRTRPALHQAIMTAFNLPDANEADETAFAKTPLAQSVWVAALILSETLAEERAS